MIRKKRNIKKINFGDSVNLIPMINIIFLLLIFFLLTGVIQKKNESNISLPESFFGKKKVNEKKELTISSDGKILFKNSPSNLDSIKSMKIISDEILVINIDEKAKIRRFNEIVNIFKSKGLKKIYINVKHKND
ncbi:MAG: hypothetical protein CNE97_02455 [alpha proteobacterium MED-G10]|nr:hypothetical protein [Rickettsiales bacterium]PDH55925.1 MAG: hypothetical protein CNE97_02455 [alpha proteobacterium MED-G10]